MGTLLIDTIIDRGITQVMNDKNKTRFTVAAGLAWANEGIRYSIAVNPSAFTARVPFVCVAGSQQSVPNNAHQLVTAAYNINPDDTPGRVIIPTEHMMLDAVDPDWRTRPAKGVIKHLTSENETPNIFDVYPPAIAGTKIMLTLALVPTALVLGQPIPFDDTYESIILDYMLSRFYQKDAEYAGNVQLAQMYWTSFNGKLAAKSTVDAANQVENKTDHGDA